MTTRCDHLDGCNRPVRSLGLCNAHYIWTWRNQPEELAARRSIQAQMRAAERCCAVAVDGTACTRPVTACGRCPKHHLRLLKHGDDRVALARQVDGVQVTTPMVFEMRQRFSAGEPLAALCVEFELSDEWAQRVIVRGEGWKDV